MTIRFTLSFFILVSIQLFIGRFAIAQSTLALKSGTITFDSNAPQEKIRAETNKFSGLLNMEQNSFAFSVDIHSFTGFNSPLQQEHFYENYMQYAIYPRSTFSGKFIDKFDPNAVAQKLRAKGQLDIHGVKKERIIEVSLTKSGSNYFIESEFNVLLEEHNISIPKIVYQKIAENINVKVKGEFANN